MTNAQEVKIEALIQEIENISEDASLSTDTLTDRLYVLGTRLEGLLKRDPLSVYNEGIIDNF